MLKTRDMEEVARLVGLVVERPGTMVAVVGGAGMGKTTAVEEALKAQEARVIWVLPVNDAKENRMRIHHILAALTEEYGVPATVSRVRKYRMLAEAIRRGRERVVLVVDDAHTLHWNTLRALKQLLEAVRIGPYRNLFSIVLIGTHELLPKIRRFWEVAGRVALYEMKGLTEEEVMAYLQGLPLTEEGLRQVAKLPRRDFLFLHRVAGMVDALSGEIGPLSDRDVLEVASELLELREVA